MVYTVNTQKTKAVSICATLDFWYFINTNLMDNISNNINIADFNDSITVGSSKSYFTEELS